ncbi:hypothetical protein MASR2M64_02460 [Candidatus Cloacimonadota bacterium]
MRNFLITIWILAMFANLAAIEIFYNQAKPIKIGYDKLLQEELTDFVTTRNKNGKDISEAWQGIAILPWLNRLGMDKWHSLKCVSSDDFEVQLHRVELDDMPAYLAVTCEGERLAESDLRLIFPSIRESKWLRGVSKIYLNPFESIPHPGQLYVWEDYTASLPWEGNTLKLESLMQHGFHQNKGTVVFVDKLMHPLALEYPFHLETAYLSRNNKGDLEITGIPLLGDLKLSSIAFIQCGPYSYLKRDYMDSLKAIGDVLLWDWDSFTCYKASGTKLIPIQSVDNVSLKPESWIGFK